MCTQTIIRNTCSHSGYGLITPCPQRRLHPQNVTRKIHFEPTPCLLCPGGTPRKGAHSVPAHPAVWVQGSPVTGFVLYTADSALVARWKSGEYPLAPEGWTPPVPLPMERGWAQRVNRLRQYDGPESWRGGWGEGDVWGGGEEMPAGLPVAWSPDEGFLWGRMGPCLPREMEEKE